MMSEMEENAQIGELIKVRQAQKIRFEHLLLKSKKVASAYAGFGHAQERWCVDDTTGRANVHLLFPKGEEREYPQYLLGADQLAEHIHEVAEAERQLASTKSQLLALGISD